MFKICINLMNSIMKDGMDVHVMKVVVFLGEDPRGYAIHYFRTCSSIIKYINELSMHR